MCRSPDGYGNMSSTYLRGRVSSGPPARNGLELVPDGQPLLLDALRSRTRRRRRGRGRDRVPRDSQSCVAAGARSAVIRARRNATHSDIQPTHSRPSRAPARRTLSAAEQPSRRARLDARLLDLLRGIRQPRDAAAGADVRAAGVEHDRADDHREVERAVVADPAEARRRRRRAGRPRARAGSSSPAASARRSSIRPGRPPRSSVEHGQPDAAMPARTVEHELVHVGVLLDLEQARRRRPSRARRCARGRCA